MGSNNNIQFSLAEEGGFVGRFARSAVLSSPQFDGIDRNELKQQLKELQRGLLNAEKSEWWRGTLVAWLLDVRDFGYEFETLIDDIEVNDFVASFPRLANALELADIFFTRLGYALPFSIEGRVFHATKLLGDLLHRMKLLNLEADGVERSAICNPLPRALKKDFVDLYQMLEDNSLKDAFYHGSLLYEKLPWYLRQCINFCTLSFPDDHLFDKDLLVLMWIALGFIPVVPGRALEDIGAAFFDALVKWSFFSLAPPNYWIKATSYKRKRLYLPSSVRDGAEFFRTNNKESTVPEHARHVSLYHGPFYESTVDIFPKPSKTFSLLWFRQEGLPSGIAPRVVCLQVPYLRLLDLSNSQLDSFPRYICCLLHLRHLDLSFTKVDSVPNTLVGLFRLMTLRLLGCPIAYIPENFHELYNLQHLDINYKRDSPPLFLGKLTLLKTLPRFHVRKKDGCRISELGELNELRGQLVIFDLENVESADEAKQAKLCFKEHLKSLSLYWKPYSNLSDEHVNPPINNKILQELKPHYNLVELEIIGFHGLELPSWISDSSFKNLSSIRLSYSKVDKLPCFAQLPNLNFLKVVDVACLYQIGDEFYSSRQISNGGFLSLVRLEFVKLDDLEVWNSIPDGFFPDLEYLRIDLCQQLKKLPNLTSLSQLSEFEISDCPFVERLPCLPKGLQSLKVSNCPTMQRQFLDEDGVVDICGAEWQRIAHIRHFDFL